MIHRALDLAKSVKKGKVLLIYGARRVGKTTLLNEFLSQTNLRYRLESGDSISTQTILGSQDFKLLKEFAGKFELIAIDEAQQIKNIGMGLKILIDTIPNIRIIATGSSSFDLAQGVGEPLTGRKRTAALYPVSQLELSQELNGFDLKERLEEYLVYGSYPEVILARSRKQKREIVEELVGSYLLKDVLSIERIRAPKQLLDLLRLLAFQVGNLVSLNEIATHIQLDVKTVARYLDILEKAFVIKRVGGFSRNMRNEIVSKSKYYFLDNGIRNGVISQFNTLKERNDDGALCENFVVMERVKYRSHKGIFGESYFWRTYKGQEVDIVEERDGKVAGYEVKWSEKKTSKVPAEWSMAYPAATYTVINPKNYLDFVT